MDKLNSTSSRGHTETSTSVEKPTLNLIDPDRLRRVHVIGVHGKDGKFFVDLSDDSSMSWGTWVNGGGRVQIGGPSYEIQT